MSLKGWTIGLYHVRCAFEGRSKKVFTEFDKRLFCQIKKNIEITGEKSEAHNLSCIRMDIGIMHLV